eukprot:1137971-Pelagomonas_calceolata.AAC.1
MPHPLYKVKSHSGIVGNECADIIAQPDTGIPSPGPGGNPFYYIAWLAQEEARPSTPETSSPIPDLMYFPDLKDALKSHMHAKLRLRYADHKTV